MNLVALVERFKFLKSYRFAHLHKHKTDEVITKKKTNAASPQSKGRALHPQLEVLPSVLNSSNIDEFIK